MKIKKYSILYKGTVFTVYKEREIDAILAIAAKLKITCDQVKLRKRGFKLW